MTMRHISKTWMLLAAAALMLPACHKKLDYDYSRWYVDPWC